MSDRSSSIAIECVTGDLSNQPHMERVRLIRFVLFDDGDRQVLQRAFADAELINP